MKSPFHPVIAILTLLLSACGSDATLTAVNMVDSDSDGLIDIHDLAMLHNMRHNLAGKSYKNSNDATGITTGCPDAGCNGYELMSDLDFDTDGDGTWTESSGAYMLDNDDNMDPYFVVRRGEGGWEPIGTSSFPFTATFEGNGHVIRNLAMLRERQYIGLFGYTTGDIRNLRLENTLADYAGGNDKIAIGTLIGQMGGGSLIASYSNMGTVDSGTGESDAVGGLVGQQESGSIIACYATGTLSSGDGDKDQAGGLVGLSNGPITASYADVATRGGNGTMDSVGGLVGHQKSNSVITSSYAIGDVNGGNGNDSVGGLVGDQSGGTITASYAIGDVNGGNGNDSVGGLVGDQGSGILAAGYAIGDVNGGNGDDYVGGLVGIQDGGTLTASYATGDADGEMGDDASGRLVGKQNDGPLPLTASYGFGTPTGETENNLGSTTVASAAALTLATAGAQWNEAASRTLGAWDFGDNNQPPALFYNDYDDTGGICAIFESINTRCGVLIPSQRHDTSPRIGNETGDIQLADGDTDSRITANITLPASIMVGDTSLDLVWSVHHDPEAIKVTTGSGMLIVNAGNRASSRWVILRATTGSGDDETIVNDYHLRIIKGS